MLKTCTQFRTLLNHANVLKIIQTLTVDAPEVWVWSTCRILAAGPSDDASPLRFWQRRVDITRLNFARRAFIEFFLWPITRRNRSSFDFIETNFFEPRITFWNFASLDFIESGGLLKRPLASARSLWNCDAEDIWNKMKSSWTSRIFLKNQSHNITRKQKLFQDNSPFWFASQAPYVCASSTSWENPMAMFGLGTMRTWLFANFYPFNRYQQFLDPCCWVVKPKGMSLYRVDASAVTWVLKEKLCKFFFNFFSYQKKALLQKLSFLPVKNAFGKVTWLPSSDKET